MKRILMICIILVCMCSTAFAAFGQKTSGPSILVAEVKSYGEHELKPEFYSNFKDTLSDELQQTGRFNVELRLSDDMGEMTPEDELFSRIHMNAIANGHLYRRELANAKMIRYGDSVKGREYYQNEAKTEARMKTEGQPYSLSPDVADIVRELGDKYNADYMIFVNLRDADVWRKTGGIFGTHTTAQEYRGKKVLVELEFYLINTKTGRVFEGQNAEKKTSLVTNALIGKYGNNFTVQDMMQNLIEIQSQGIIKIIDAKGLKAVGGE